MRQFATAKVEKYCSHHFPFRQFLHLKFFKSSKTAIVKSLYQFGQKLCQKSSRFTKWRMRWV